VTPVPFKDFFVPILQEQLSYTELLWAEARNSLILEKISLFSTTQELDKLCSENDIL
jgi:hypothetical protein